MAITYRDSAQVFSSGASSSITIPASVQDGDLMIVQAVGGWGPSIPSGWTQDYLSNDQPNVRCCVAYKVAGPSDAGTSVNFTWQAGYNHVINLIAVTGSTTLRAPRVHLRSSTGGTATTGPSAAAAGDCVVYLGGNRQDGGPPTLTRGTTVQSASDGSTVAAGIVAYEILGSNEYISNTFTAPSSGNGYLYSQMIVSDGGTPTNFALVSTNYAEALIDGQSSALVSTNYAEALVDGPSSALISTNYVEVMYSSVSAQIATVYSEALYNSTPDARVATVYSEALANAVPDARIATIYTEALISSPRIQAETVYGEILASGAPNVQAEGVYGEVLAGGTPAVQAEIVYAEVLVSLSQFPSRRGWGITSI